MSGTLSYTLQTDLASDPNFPGGWSYQDVNSEAFDFTRNRYYHHISGGANAGIVIVDLNTMHVLQTVTMNQMYAGTAFGSPAGSPVEQVIWDIGCGNGTDIYIRTSYAPGIGIGQYCHFTRVSASTFKVTGDYFVSATFPPPIRSVVGSSPVVNTTTSHTIVAYIGNPGLGLGPQIFDGTGMAPIGLGPTLAHGAYNVALMPGATTGASCDFWMLNFDSGSSGNIDIWRISVSDSLVITSTKTGTVNVLSVLTPTPALAIPQSNYDATHNTIIMWLTNTSGGATGPPLWIVSANFNGTINWVRLLPSDVGVGSNAHAQLTGTTLMVGSGNALEIIDTGTGAITFSGSVPLSPAPGSFFRIWDAGRNSYWTYTFGNAFTRIDFVPAGGGGGPGGGGGTPLRLALDNVVATVTPTLLEVNLISLRWSDDRGHSWGSPVTQDIGEAGEYRTSLQWQRLAYARDRCFEISWSVPMRTALQGCWVDVTPAQS